MDLNQEELTLMLANMYRIRFFEKRAKDLYTQGLIRGSLHSYIGEEAIAVGACSAIRENDCIISTHRGHGHCIAKGGNLKKMMAELFGRETGYCKGRGGSMHLIAPETGMLGACGIVGGGIPISLGVGLSSQYRQSGQITLCFFGDGACNQGSFHESLNLASLWRLPIIFICENNVYAVTTPISRSFAIEDIAVRAISYGIPGKVVDGNDILAVYETVNKAVEKARKGEGSTLIECKTSRWESHCVSISETRTKGEIEECRKKDPILRLETRLLRDRLLTKNESEKIKEKVELEVEEAVEFARKSPFPKAESLMDYVYCNQL